MSTTLTFESIFSAGPEEVFDLHTRPEALRRLSPPFPPIVSIEQDGRFEAGTTVRIRIGVGPLAIDWVAVLEEVLPGRKFVDVQKQGPLRSWRHEHTFEAVPGGCVMRDEVSWKSLGPLALADRILIRPLLQNYFALRHAALREWIKEEESKQPAAGETGQERKAS